MKYILSLQDISNIEINGTLRENVHLNSLPFLFYPSRNLLTLYIVFYILFSKYKERKIWTLNLYKKNREAYHINIYHSLLSFKWYSEVWRLYLADTVGHCLFFLLIWCIFWKQTNKIWTKYKCDTQKRKCFTFYVVHKKCINTIKYPHIWWYVFQV